MPIIKLIIRTLFIILMILIALRVFTIVLNRAPGVIVALSVITSTVLLFALFKGSFSAVGLHTKKSISLALISSVIILIVSSIILIFVQ